MTPVRLVPSAVATVLDEEVRDDLVTLAFLVEVVRDLTERREDFLAAVVFELVEAETGLVDVVTLADAPAGAVEVLTVVDAETGAVDALP